MGDIADMMLEGLLDEQTGEYIGDINEEIYGSEAPGFPISYESGYCNICDKTFNTQNALLQHIQVNT